LHSGDGLLSAVYVPVSAEELHGDVADIVEGVGEEPAHEAYRETDPDERQENDRNTHHKTSPLIHIIDPSGDLNKGKTAFATQARCVPQTAPDLALAGGGFQSTKSLA